MAIRLYVYAAGIAAGLALLAACGDDVTEVTNVSEKSSPDQVKKFKELPKCDKDAEGSMVYVKDSAKVFLCTDGDWVRLNGKNGADGANGKDGKDGKDGEDGSSCTVKQNKKKTGFDLVCDGKKVGSIENGSDGKDGSDGSDGSGCTLKQNKKKGGYDIVCDGVTKGTVTDGDDGSDCVLKEGKNGQIDVKCGQKTTTLYKALCGSDPFDPETQFCVDNKPYPKCHKADNNLGEFLNNDGTYDVSEFFCDKIDLLLRLCGALSVTYDYSTQFCGKFNPIDRCKEVAEGVDPDALNNGVFSETTHFCHNGVLWKNCGGFDNLGHGGVVYNPDEQFCSSDGDNALVVDRCGKQKKTYDITDSMCVNGRVQYAKTCCDPGNQGENWCEDKHHIYDVRTHFCDDRPNAEGRIYEYKKLVKTDIDGDTVYSKVWMTENVDYEITDASRCLPDDRKCSNGRFYTWAVAKDACPEGWNLPDVNDYSDLIRAFGDYGGTYSETGATGFSAKKLGYITVGEDGPDVYNPLKAYFWTKASRSGAEGEDDGYYFSVSDYAEVNDANHTSKDDFLNVRCVKRH